MPTAPVKATALPAVYRANLEFQSHVPFQHSRTRGRRGFCTLVHSLLLLLIIDNASITHNSYHAFQMHNSYHVFHGLRITACFFNTIFNSFLYLNVNVHFGNQLGQPVQDCSNS